MANLSFDAAKFAVPCPHCGHKVEDLYRNLKAKPDRQCAGCGVTFTIDPKPLEDGLRALNKKLRGFS